MIETKRALQANTCKGRRVNWHVSLRLFSAAPKGWEPQCFGRLLFFQFLTFCPGDCLESPIFVLILSADFQLGAESLPSDGLPLPGGGLKGRLVPLGFDLRL